MLGRGGGSPAHGACVAFSCGLIHATVWASIPSARSTSDGSDGRSPESSENSVSEVATEAIVGAGTKSTRSPVDVALARGVHETR